MDCPVCKVNLVMADKQGVEIDYCPKCRGIWLDRGELEKIIERSKGYAEFNPAPQQPAPQQPAPKQLFNDYQVNNNVPQNRNKYQQDKHQYKGNRNRNFLEDIFDIFDS